ncbi:hypothetical protein OH77DRAFT_856229 [Trametes cingulata]|nr:hypothetical protein OH77DRAFT_856229 [Trametes cingulata]
MSQSSLTPLQVDPVHEQHPGTKSTSVTPQPSNLGTVSALDTPDTEGDIDDTIPFSRMSISDADTPRDEETSCSYPPQSQSRAAQPPSRTWSASTWLDDEEPLIITPIRCLLERNTVLGSELSESPTPSRQSTMESENSASEMSDELDAPPDGRSSSLESSWTPTAARTCFGTLPSVNVVTYPSAPVRRSL